MQHRAENPFLLIGHATDSVCRLVGEALDALGCEVIRTAAPLAAPFALGWRIDTDPCCDARTWRDADRLPRQIAGVLVRSSGECIDPDRWDPLDLAYVRTETQAALIAWLWSLPCPVVNRPGADLWFRPSHSYSEWHERLARCGLPVAPVCYTNEIGVARDFAAQWAGRATYVPFTSPSRYPLATAHDWDELARLVSYVPVCLIAPASHSTHATVVGDRVVFDREDAGAIGALEPGLVRLARELELDFVQVEIAIGSSGPHCVKADPYPVVERHDAAARSTIVARLVELLLDDARIHRTGPPEARRLATRPPECVR